MKLEQFIEKAVKGGWNPSFSRGMGVIRADLGTRTLKVIKDAPTLSYGDMFLDPDAWRAVGKVEGWGEEWNREIWSQEISAWNETKRGLPEWQYHWLRMIDALADGKTIAQYLETL